MKQLVDAFFNLPASQGILLIAAAVSVVAIVAVIVSHISFRAGQRYAEKIGAHFYKKRRELESIRL